MSGGQNKLKHISCTHAKGCVNASATAYHYGLKAKCFHGYWSPFYKIRFRWEVVQEVGWINIWNLGAEFSVRWRHFVRLQERRYVAEDAVLSVEDGDCVEAAEEPPELMPGQDRTDSEPIEEHAKTTVSTILCPYQNETSHIRRKWFWLMLVHWPVRVLTLA